MAASLPEKSEAIAQTQLEDITSSTSLEKNLQGDKLHFNAKDGAALEHDLTPLQALKAYPMAVFWALMVSMCVVMVCIPSHACCFSHGSAVFSSAFWVLLNATLY